MPRLFPFESISRSCEFPQSAVLELTASASLRTLNAVLEAPSQINPVTLSWWQGGANPGIYVELIRP